jgi:uncharacterized membrane protein YdjX (TVP38/TMEM64 family)
MTDATPSGPLRGAAPRATVAVLMALAVAAFFALDLDQRLTLGALKASLATLRGEVAERPATAAAAFFAVYVGATGLGVPGAVVLTLAGGALFGFWRGLALASFASTIGATLSCLAARYVLRDWVQSHFGVRLASVNQGMEREGAFYLFTMRMIPALPYFVINLVMGLTPMPVRTFAWVSQLGMLPATSVFVFAGTRLAQVESPSGVLSPGLLAALTFMGLLPIAARRLVAWLRARRKP